MTPAGEFFGAMEKLEDGDKLTVCARGKSDLQTFVTPGI